MITLRSFQAAGRDFLSPRPGALLADQPGLGKTAQAIAAADDTAAGRIVVPCPAALRTNWTREIRRFSHLGGSIGIARAGERVPDARWTLVSYEAMREPSVIHQLAARRFDVAVPDEMHRLKGGPDTATGRAFYDHLVPSVGAVWGLSGTPAPNHVGELFWWLDGVCPGALAGLPRDYYRFLSRFTRYRDTAYGPRPYCNRNTEELRERLAEYMLRRLLRDVEPDLPPMSTEHLVLDGQSADVAGLQRHPEIAALQAIAQALRTPEEQEELLHNSQLPTLRRLTSLLKVKPYAELVVDELNGAPERKRVVMAWHRETIAALARQFEQAGLQPVVIVGGMTDARRQEAVDLFQSATSCRRVLVGQMLPAGEGLTMTAADQVDIFESSFVPKDIEQAARRVLRIGQTASRCVCRFVSLAGSVDELLAQVLDRKVRMLLGVFG